MGELEFQSLDDRTFPSVRMAMEVVRTGGTAGAIYNAANEVAVQAFLEQRIDFGGIFDLVEQGLREIPARNADRLDVVLEDDAATRAFIHDVLDTMDRRTVSTIDR